jgi:putative protease
MTSFPKAYDRRQECGFMIDTLNPLEDSCCAERAVDGASTLTGSPGRKKPELLAPAGDRTCLIAAVENGADAVYFGLQRHNARARANNFDGAELPEVMALLHRRGVKGYITLNTLVFSAELPELEATIRELASADVDAVIVQDPGLARLIRAITQDLEIHASTQMSVTSEDGIALASELGCTRVILARELALADIGRIRHAINFPVEVFVHGALCVAYSGQCLTSEALGGRSANRGECAQACRMPYQMVCDGRLVDLDNIQYLLSPQDLAAYDLIPRIIELGVASLKIEGRLKSAEYVANIVRHYREAIDAAWAGRPVAFTARDVQEMQLSFSRGFSHGFLDGNNHKVLVRGDYAKKRGIFLGIVESITGAGVRLTVSATVKPGDGLVFDGDEATGRTEQGGRVYEVIALDQGRTDSARCENDGGPPARVELRFGREAIDLRGIVTGQPVWKTDDPELTRRLRRSFEGPPSRKIALNLQVVAVTGEPLSITGATSAGDRAAVCSREVLAAAESRAADVGLFKTQLGRLGGTIYQLGELEVRIDGRPMVPMSLLNQLRRELVARLDEAASTVRAREIALGPVLPKLLEPIIKERQRQIRLLPGKTAPVELAVLCRQTEQIEAAVAVGISTIYADYQDIKRYAEAVAAVRRGDGRAAIYLATPRIEKPGEAKLFGFLTKQSADGILVRNAGGIRYCADRGVPFVADFSLNAANPLTVDFLKSRGAVRITASYDLNVEQLVHLLDGTPASWLEVVIHQQIPMFHMEHCVFCAFLSPGTDATNCGRPCDTHDVKLRDRVGMEHPLRADVGCRNTLYNAVPQTTAEFLPRLLRHGMQFARIEFLDDSAETVKRTIRLYREVIAGKRDGKSLWRELKATNQYGVTRGPLAVL